MPVTRKVREEDLSERETENHERTFKTFVHRPRWFVLSQTTGDEFIAPCLPGWNAEQALATLEIEQISFTHTDGNCQGYARHRQIAINPVAQLPHKTRFHEIAHVVLGHTTEASSDYDTTNNNNRFVSSVASYDAAGNITTDAKFRSLTYTYDANGRQKSASNGSWTQTQVYDCAGQRVQTTVGSSNRTMIYDAFGQNVAEYSGSTLEREHIYRGGSLLAIYEAGANAFKYVLTDGQGSTRAVLNSSGAVIARHDYVPFGEEIGAGIGLRTTSQGFGASDTNRQKYGLTERDESTGLDHTWWRKYENRSGRWTSPDPMRGTIGAPQSFNAYTYAANDPINFIDPTGLEPQEQTKPQITTHIDPATGKPFDVPGPVASVDIGAHGPFSGGDGNDITEVAATAVFREFLGSIWTRIRQRPFICTHVTTATQAS